MNRDYAGHLRHRGQRAGSIVIGQSKPFLRFLVLFAVGLILAACAVPIETGKTFHDCERDCPRMIAVPGGAYHVGMPEGALGRDVVIHRFAIAENNVTIDEFSRFVEASGYRMDKGEHCRAYDKEGRIPDASWRKPGRAAQGGDASVACVSWLDAHAYIDWLNRVSGEHYRLPSEAEWEYFAYNSSAAATQNPGLKQAPWAGANPAPRNLLGDVEQWMEDSEHAGNAPPPKDGSPWPPEPEPAEDENSAAQKIVLACWHPDGTARLLRGTAGEFESGQYRWNIYAMHTQVITRRWSSIGFRVARNLD